MFSGSFKESVFIAEDNQRFAVLLEKLIKRGFLKNSGIQEPISTDELLNLFEKNSLDDLADKIIDTANNNGGIDNITAIVIEL